ncbi:RNA polymerase sigma factor [Persicitalea jodogahamensis]|uniref:DNA-directed RNA polymerase sigma-70 factor n=1 Tax=Persicitalea jodogahamensis TaxID=402147 RepID=A0A8J3D7Y6_9BACT|nr:sigma-70 family RNA polymerase sigma factor [Persicitalea jodogahamensis]GHB65722.1 DNA-directed RNA polymerase sigma-70 factor [Persicitalea jodogahamensis]
MIKENEHSDDDALWQAVRAGDEHAFECLYRRYFRDLFHYGKQFLRDESAINDAIQDLFVDLWRIRLSLGQARSVKFYLMASLRRKIHRSQRKERPFETAWEELPESLLPTQSSAELIFTAREDKTILTKKVNAWLEQLPPRQREALLLRHYYDMPYPEIAELLDIKEQTSRNLVQKALHTLRKHSILLVIITLETIFQFLGK